MIFDVVKEALASQLEIDGESITEKTDIIGDLGADSLDVVELIMSLEEDFGIVITDEAVHDFRTVGDVAEFIKNITGNE